MGGLRSGPPTMGRTEAEPVQELVAASPLLCSALMAT